LLFFVTDIAWKGPSGLCEGEAAVNGADGTYDIMMLDVYRQRYM
jgi:hypothetical protein